MRQTLDAKQKELKRIFSDDYLFEIPPYQRPYAWTREQTSELLDDLLTAMDYAVDLDELPPYFLGSVVLIKDPTSAPAQVVDGQQRLTTITILFCALREMSAEDKARRLHKYVCEEGDDFAGTHDRFRVTLRPRDREFFRQNIQEQGQLDALLKRNSSTLTDSQQRMHENTAYLYEQLSKLTPDRRDRLAAFMIRRCYLVVVSASNRDSAYRVFSVLNTRGLDLSPTDILKADIIGETADGAQARYTDIWEQLEEELGRDDFRDLFGHIRMIYMESKARGTLNQEFRKGVLEKENLTSEVFIEQKLQPYADAYQQVSRENATDAKNIDKYLRYLQRLDNHDWIPPAMEFFRRHPDDIVARLEFVRRLERLAYALFVRRANINMRIDRYARILRETKEGKPVAEIESLQLSDVEKSNFIASLDGPIYLHTRVRTPLLLRLDELLSDDGVIHNRGIISIEHVLPQRPASGSKWLDWFPQEDERNSWTHRLANLVLLSRRKNALAQNYEFDRKKSQYFTKRSVATFALTTQVLNESEWTPHVLDRRQRDLLESLSNEWHLH